MNALTAEWIKKADDDLSVALGLLRRKRIPANIVCFLSQQAAEKYLKALLQDNRIAVVKTHMLEDIALSLAPAVPGVQLFSRELKFLTDFAVKYRYPGFDATNRQARLAATFAKSLRVFARGHVK